ncbi:MAG: methylglyoxal synthase [Bacteroidales bacterium]|nr:methylglyoxal synthase [Bacteroidales bacterium]
MNKTLTIALVAHDNRKSDMITWSVKNADFLSKHNIVCTGTTGTLIKEAFEAKGIRYNNIRCMHSGPIGGDTEIAAMVVRKEIDMAVFLIDDLNPQPHEADIQMLLRQCRIHNIPIACNQYSADLILSSPLWNDENYIPEHPTYVKFDREAFANKQKEK